MPLAGWLVLKPLRHVEAFAELSTDEAAAFGLLQQRATSALTDLLQPVKVYVCLFAEADNAANIHFHLMPRFADMPAELRGYGVFTLLREAMQSGQNQTPIGEVEHVVDAVRQRLSTS